MSLLLLLVGPTIMLFLGLNAASSVPIAFLLFYGWLALVPLIALLAGKNGNRLNALQQNGLVFDRKNALIGGVIGLSFFLLIVASGYFFQSVLFDRPALNSLLIKWQFTGDLTGWLIVILVFINPLLEEYYWRGFLLQQLLEKQKPGTAIFLTAFFYSLYHLLSVIPLFAAPLNVMMVVPVFVAGVIWGYLQVRQRSLYGSIISHVFADMGIMTVYLLFLA